MGGLEEILSTTHHFHELVVFVGFGCGVLPKVQVEMLEVERMVRLNSMKSKGVQRHTFASLTLHCDRERDWKLSPRERFKKLNEWRVHTPTASERKNLKISVAIEKLDLLEISHFLILSGGNNHMEFSIEVSVAFFL